MSYWQQLVGTLAASRRAGLSNGWTSLKFLGATPTLGTAGRTCVSMVTSRAPFTKARLTFYNYSTAAPLSLVADVAASPTMSNTGASLTHIPVTVAGSTAITVPAATTSVDGQTVPGCVRSDEINVTSVPRTDTPGADHIFYHRVYSAQQLPLWGFSFVDHPQAAVSGRTGHAAGGAFTGNAVGTQTAITLFSSPGSFTQVAQIDLYCPGEQSCDAIIFGDSITAGTNPGGLTYLPTFNMELFKLFNDAGFRNMSLANMGVGGNTRPTTSATIRSVAPAALPKLALLWNMTVNSPGANQADIDAQWASVLDDIAFLQGLGCTVGLVTMHARGPTANALIEANNVRTRAWCAANNVMLVDFAAAVADPGFTDGRISDPYVTVDWTHMELAGVQRGASHAFLPAITAAL